MKVGLFLRGVISIKFVLVVSFIVLMTISGVLGFTFTYMQSKQSLNDVAEISMNEVSYSVVQSVTAKLSIGHQMNKMEIRYFRGQNISMNNWISAFYIWRHLGLNNLMPEVDPYIITSLTWLPRFGIFIGPLVRSLVLVNFNNSVCNDTVNFPRSNCSVQNYEDYVFDTNTGEVFWNEVVVITDINVFQTVEWKYGGCGLALAAGWKASDTYNSYFAAYSVVFHTQSIPTFLCIELTAAVTDEKGNPVGSVAKDLLLKFVSEQLFEMSSTNPLLSVGGRAFVYEQDGLGFIGASHGNIFRELKCTGTVEELCYFGSTVQRFRVDQSDDTVIARAGAVLYDGYRGIGGGNLPGKFTFSVGDSNYLHINQPCTDAYGLRWMVSVVLSLTELFKDITNASMRMLGITAAVIVGLSVTASLGITFATLRPLQRLILDMENVSSMRLERVNPTRSKLQEISLMQEYFVAMVAKLVEYRAYLPEAILSSVDGDPGSVEDLSVPRTKNLHKVDSVRSSAAGSTPQSSPHSIGNKSPKRWPMAMASPKFGTVTRKASDGASSGIERKASFSQQPQQIGVSSPLNFGGLTERFLSCMQVDIKAFHTMLESEPAVAATHAEVMEIITQAVQQNYGICNPVLGDKIAAFWNVKQVKADHAVHCVTAALQIGSGVLKFQGKNTETQLKGVRIACTGGLGSFGSMGTKTSRSFTILSTCIPRGFLLQKLSKVIPLSVICDAAIQERITYRYNTRLVCVLPKPIVDYSSSNSASGVGSDKVYEISVSEGNIDEWMYEIQQKESQQSKNADFELGVRALFSGNEVVAGERLRAFVSDHPSDFLASWYLGHMSEIRRMLDPQFGLMVPGSALQ